MDKSKNILSTHCQTIKKNNNLRGHNKRFNLREWRTPHIKNICFNSETHGSPGIAFDGIAAGQEPS